ncbi:hypothetical protein tinsulaeT_06680 [Thalassotalea insulae]|uniref:DUF423 domain-containing protein n=1 Tax=Thalassotalea insulae TaxID=2056778 RepID=A0ABQ6GMW3_9GAMM|nr:hypothetical protein [Thalassotalea insulae]GLX77328.1 hypothetical protein tinsulaeT_06680 [Thalassotalea insulae]
MNLWVLSAGIIGLCTALIHILAGQIDPVRPFLRTNLPDVQKATLLASWHMVSVILCILATFLVYVGWVDQQGLYQVVAGISLIFVTFSLVFILVGWFFFGYRSFINLPQWSLLLPIGTLGLIGVI